MKLLTLNTRGLGNPAKQREVQKLLRKESIDFCFLQETKLESVDQSVCKRIWYSDDFDSAFKGSAGKSGGLLCIGIQLGFLRLQYKKGKVFSLSRAFLGEIKFPAT